MEQAEAIEIAKSKGVEVGSHWRKVKPINIHDSGVLEITEIVVTPKFPKPFANASKPELAPSEPTIWVFWNGYHSTWLENFVLSGIWERVSDEE